MQRDGKSELDFVAIRKWAMKRWPEYPMYDGRMDPNWGAYTEEYFRACWDGKGYATSGVKDIIRPAWEAEQAKLRQTTIVWDSDAQPKIHPKPWVHMFTQVVGDDIPPGMTNIRDVEWKRYATRDEAVKSVQEWYQTVAQRLDDNCLNRQWIEYRPKL